MKSLSFVLLLSFVAGHAIAQPTERTSQPTPYFQQHVYYMLNATLVDDSRTPHLEGQGTLHYTNNSSDTLSEVYFHLYWNLFKKGSYGEKAPNRDHGVDDTYDLEGITIKHFSQQLSSGPEDDIAALEIDNTIMHLRLKQPIPPGGDRTFAFEWVGELPNYGIRSTWGYHDDGARNFATAQWYPQICVYDQHGWHPDQYIGMGEFYTDYGMFDVTLHLPQSLSTVVSTGYQTNPEILGASVLERLAFARSHPDSIVHIADHSNDAAGPNDNILQTWKFHADSVRDFAWCADEGYIWDATYANGTMHHALYWDYSRGLWAREGARIAKHTIQFDSKLAGQYLYPNLFMCETYEGGMEYPGLVFIGAYKGNGRDHDPQQTMMHEIGHQWYPMMMGSNETDYGYMDEGFNTFITTQAQEAYYGRYNNSYDPGGQFNDDERTSNYRWAWYEDHSGLAEPAETKADLFQSYHSYAVATYGITNNIFFMLRYVMGDSAFAHFLHAYYDRWHMGHPYPDDLRAVAEEFDRKEGDTAHVRARGDLRWFFDEWFRKTWKLDFALSDMHTNGNTVNVTVKRLERAVMPLDIVFTLADGSKVQRWIAVDDWLRTAANEHKYTYTFDQPAVFAEINPGNELYETNRLNNTSSWLPPMEVSLVPKITGDVKPIDAYAIRSSPFYESRTFGWTLLGSYLERDDRLALGARFTIPDGGKLIPGGVLQYHTVLDGITPNTDVDVALVRAVDRSFAGIQFAQLFTSPSGETPNHIINIGYDWSQYFSNTQPLNRLELGYSFKTNLESFNYFSFAVDAEAGLGDPRTTYTKLSLETDLRLDIGAEWNAYLRLFGGAAQPSNGVNFPLEAQYRFGSASRIQEFADIFTSNFGSGDRGKIRNAAASGPLMRGYQLDENLNGRVAGSATLELGNSSLTPFAVLRQLPVVGSIFRLFGLTLFADEGFITNRFCTCRLKDVLAIDFGIGLRLSGAQGYFRQTLGLDLLRTDIQIDFPLYLSAPLDGLKWRFRSEVYLRQNF